MNIQPGQSARSRQKVDKKVKRSFLSHSQTLGKMLLVMLALAGISIAYVNLNQRIGETNRQIERAIAEKKHIEDEISNKRNRIEELSAWEHVKSKIDQYALKLHPANPGQSRTMVLTSPAVSERRFVAWQRSVRQLPGMTAKR